MSYCKKKIKTKVEVITELIEVLFTFINMHIFTLLKYLIYLGFCHYLSKLGIDQLLKDEQWKSMNGRLLRLLVLLLPRLFDACCYYLC